MTTIEALRHRLLTHNFGPTTVDQFEQAVRADERDKWADPEHDPEHDTEQPMTSVYHPPHCGCMTTEPGHSAVF